jgi:hypothetical protein
VDLRALVQRRELQYPPSALTHSDNANLRDLLIHREIQSLPWSSALPTFHLPFNNFTMLPTLPAEQLIEAQPDIRQFLLNIHNLNLMREYQDDLLSRLQATILQENLAIRAAMLPRHVHESPIAAYLLSRSIVRDSQGNQSVAIPDPPPPPLPPPVHILPQPLARPEDRFSLSEFQVLLRQNIEVFQVTHEEASIHVRGRNTAIYLHQVGIRCIHCKHVPMKRRKKGFMYFPSNTQRIYQAAQNMATAHMISGLCEEMPVEVKEQFQILRTGRSISGKAGRVYWAESVETHLGLVNTPLGIRSRANAAVL